MKAIRCTTYGPPDVLRLQAAEKPTPKDTDVLIRVCAATVTAGDVNVRGFTFVPAGFGSLVRLMFGLRQPRQAILGAELAGVIEAVGKDVTAFQPGDKVYGIDSQRFGAYAEYAFRPEAGALAIQPAQLSHEEAAAIPFGAVTALYLMRDRAGIQRGQKVLIHGASGGGGRMRSSSPGTSGHR